MQVHLPDPVDADALLSALPGVWPDATLRGRIAGRLATDERVVVVLDDDPTGTQTVHDVSVLTHWDLADLRGALSSGDPAFYVLTNTRSMTLARAQKVNREIARNLVAASRTAGRRPVVVSRSDSTLRGHFPGEVDALAEALAASDGTPFDATCIIPYFAEGGRLTVGDVHWVREGAHLVPAAQTPYARDAVFGYTRSDLPGWVEERTCGAVRASEVISVSIEALRTQGPEGVRSILQGVQPGSILIVNASDYRDLEVFVVGVQSMEAEGRRYLFRTAASFVKVLAGIPDRGLLSSQELASDSGAGGGLVVVGSHVPQSTAQLEWLLDRTQITGVELKVRHVLNAERRVQEVDRVARWVDDALGRGRNALVYTSREVVVGGTKAESLAIAESVSSALTEVVARLGARPRFVIGKGGITASDLATEGMHVRSARVLGQVLPGVPVWRLGSESIWPGAPYVVFPGNVGDESALADAVGVLAASSPAGSRGVQAIVGPSALARRA
jgi:uncharacterized protein YgbK (DUF1537 family)